MKLKPTHTPGPWFAECMDEGQSGGYVYNASSRLEDDGRAICDMRPSVRLKHADKRRSDSFVYSQEDISNARLIAAAPDLLQALLWIQEGASAHIGLNNEWVHWICTQAINRATKESAQ